MTIPPEVYTLISSMVFSSTTGLTSDGAPVAPQGRDTLSQPRSIAFQRNNNNDDSQLEAAMSLSRSLDYYYAFQGNHTLAMTTALQSTL